MALSRRSFACLTLAVGLVACSKPKTDPPPPAASVDLPAAAPGATGALAAGRTTAPGPDEDEPFDDEGEQPLIPPPGLAPVPADPGDGGVNL